MMHRFFSTSSTTGILSAFSQDGISGSIYVEAARPVDVANAMRGVNGVVRLRNGSIRMSRIPLDDYIPLLEMNLLSPSIKSGTWVRIKRPTLYRNDLAIIDGTTTSISQMTVWAVPRLRLNGKRQRGERGRPSASLASPEALRKCYGNWAVKNVKDSFWTFREQLYRDGLIILDVDIIDVSTKWANPTKEEVQLFHGTQNQKVVQAIKIFNSTLNLRIDDMIQVAAGQHQGLLGHVTGLHEDGMVEVKIDGDTAQSLDLGRWEIRKSFNRGDFVQILAGEYEGSTGFIIDLEEESATIYSHDAAMQNSLSHWQEVPGEEVSLYV